MIVKLDDPAMTETCLETPCDATLTITAHGLNVPGATTDFWNPYLVGKTARGDLARLGFSVARRWDVRWQSGESLRVRRVIRMSTCPGTAGDQEITESATEIRERDGTLLMLSAPDIPLAAGGEALLPPGFGAELKISWTDLQCPAYQGPGVGSVGGGRRTVGIVVASADRRETSVVTWGRSTRLRLRGEEYVVAVNQGWVLANGAGCGRAKLTIYKSGYLKEQ